MENAAKALLMAAEILIGVLILSLAVYLFGSFSSSSASIEKQMEQDQINNFNNQFLAYDTSAQVDNSGKTKEWNIYDIYTVANLARENNLKYEFEESDGFYIKVDIEKKHNGTIHNIEKKGNLKKENFVQEYMQEDNSEGEKKLVFTKFKCTVTIDENTKRVNHIVFKEI